MAKTEQHQEPIKKAVERAETASAAVRAAEEKLHAAIEQADPKLMLSSQGRLNHVKHETTEASEHLHDVNPDHRYDAQLAQVTEHIQQSQEDLEIAMDDSHMPKQIR